MNQKYYTLGNFKDLEVTSQEVETNLSPILYYRVSDKKYAPWEHVDPTS